VPDLSEIAIDASTTCMPIVGAWNHSGHHISTPHATKHPKFCGQNVHTTSAVEHQNRYLNAYNKRLGVSGLPEPSCEGSEASTSHLDILSNVFAGSIN
jgi:hypothetical protein